MTLDNFNDQYARALKSFKASNGKLAGDLLTLARAVWDAKCHLPERQYLLFLRHNELSDLKVADRKRRKTLLRIGKAEPVLRAYVAKLPASLTTLRQLCKLSPDALTSHIDAGNIHPMMSGLDANLLIVDTRQKKPTRSPKLLNRPADYSITITFLPGATFDVKNAETVLASLRRYVDKHGDALGISSVRMSLDLELELAANAA